MKCKMKKTKQNYFCFCGIMGYLCDIIIILNNTKYA